MTTSKMAITPVSILLVEDNDDDVELARMAFSRMPATRLCVARDGQEALDYLFRQGEHATLEETPPDFVLLDLHLPKYSGIEVLQKIRASKETACLPVIMLTASGREEDIDSAYNNGANGYIQKPTEFAEFQHAVQVIREYWGEMTKLPSRSGG